jgi:hypothetical protein
MTHEQFIPLILYSGFILIFLAWLFIPAKSSPNFITLVIGIVAILGAIVYYYKSYRKEKYKRIMSERKNRIL